MAANTETGLPEEGNIREADTYYTFFWKGKAPEESHIQGVGFAIKTQLVKQHNLIPNLSRKQLQPIETTDVKYGPHFQ